MNFKDLEPFFKSANFSMGSGQQNPQIQQIASLFNQQNTPNEDPDGETVDDNIVDTDKSQSQEQNIEGQLMEPAFKELEVQEAIENQKQQEQLSPTPSYNFDSFFDKNAHRVSYFELLKKRYGKQHNRR